MSSQFDRASRLAFYFGATVVLGFISWAQVAPLAGTDTAWWNPTMGKVAVLGLLFMIAAVLLVILSIELEPRRKRSEEAPR